MLIILCLICGYAGITSVLSVYRLKLTIPAFTAEQLAMFYEVCRQMEKQLHRLVLFRMWRFVWSSWCLHIKNRGLDKDQVYGFELTGLYRICRLNRRWPMMMNWWMLCRYSPNAIRIYYAKDDKKYQAGNGYSCRYCLMPISCLGLMTIISSIPTDNAMGSYLCFRFVMFCRQMSLSNYSFLTIFRQPQTAAHTDHSWKTGNYDRLPQMIDKTPALFTRMELIFHRLRRSGFCR